MNYRGNPSKERAVLFSIAALKFLLHFFTSENYGYFRDELYYLACSEHLSFGYVDHPPVSIFLLKLQRLLLGDSLHALRFLPALAGAANVYLTGRITTEIGGGIVAMGLAMFAALAAPEYLATNHYFSMNSFDQFFWTLSIYQLLLTLRRPDIARWTILGVCLGLGLMNKISVLWLVAGLFVGLLLTEYRRLLATRGPYIAGVIALIIFSPYVIWQFQNDWATLEFMRNATTNKMAGQSAAGFFADQILNMNPISAPLWITGLITCFRTSSDRRLRIPGWIYVAVTAILLASPASRSGYLAPVYTALFACGALSLDRLRQPLRRILIPTYALLIILSGAFLLPFAVPVLPVDSYIAYAKKVGVEPSTEEKKELSDLPQFYADMFGWPEITQQVMDVYHHLPYAEKARCRIFGSNYGEASAIAFFGSKHGVPPAISSHNNYWIWGPGDFSGETLIMIGGSAERKRHFFQEVHAAGVTSCRHCMPYENNRTIFLCRKLKIPVSDFWAQIKHYD